MSAIKNVTLYRERKQGSRQAGYRMAGTLFICIK